MAKKSNFQRNGRLRLEPLEPRRLLAVVTSAEDSGLGTLRFALETGDPIVTFDVDAMGTPNIFLESELRIDRPVIIDGEQNNITIFGSESTRCMNVLDPAGGDFPVEMRNMTMSRCRSTEGFGGAIRNEAKLTLENMSFLSNSAISGGGLMTTGPTTILSSRFAENETFQGEGGGLLIATDSKDVGIFQSEFDRNRASRGGGIFIAGTDGNNVVILDSKVTNNVATDFNGGGIFMAASAGNVTNISDSTIA
ncbi:MAG: right-handed parallel beta-helix repeat-containing protein, partial [Planctomycetota bacterium]